MACFRLCCFFISGESKKAGTRRCQPQEKLENERPLFLRRKQYTSSQLYSPPSEEFSHFSPGKVEFGSDFVICHEVGANLLDLLAVCAVGFMQPAFKINLFSYPKR